VIDDLLSLYLQVGAEVGEGVSFWIKRHGGAGRT
jgi:hypothetical protein